MNGWGTDRRMRSMRGYIPHGRCLLCNEASDSIEHIAQCKISKQSFAKYDMPCNNIVDFLALDMATYPHDTPKKVKCISIIYLMRTSIIYSTIDIDVQATARAACRAIMLQ